METQIIYIFFCSEKFYKTFFLCVNDKGCLTNEGCNVILKEFRKPLIFGKKL